MEVGKPFSTEVSNRLVLFLKTAEFLKRIAMKTRGGNTMKLEMSPTMICRINKKFIIYQKTIRIFDKLTS